MTVELFFLGAPRFRLDGEAVESSAGKAVALLAYLAGAGRPQPRDRLLALLWAESSEEAARKNLRNTLWAIRRGLGDVILPTTGDRVALSPAVWADTRAFSDAMTGALSGVSNLPVTQYLAGTASPVPGRPPTHDAPDPESPIAHLQSSLALYGGPFLDGLALAEAPDFELWQTAERERLEQLYLRGLAALVDLYRTEGQWAEVIGAAEAALKQDNLQEAMYRSVMEGYARLGDRPAALHRYDALRDVLARELGVDPLPETEALRAAIASGEGLPAAAGADMRGRLPRREAYAPPSARPVSESDGTHPAPWQVRDSALNTPAQRDPSTGRPAAETQERDVSLAAPGEVEAAALALPFVGRAAERAALDEELAAAAAGAVRVALITGEVGIGKSRLWQEWRRLLPADPRRLLLETRCLEPTQALPFAPVAALLRSPDCAPRLLEEASDSPVPRVWLAEVARLLPEVRAARPDLPTLAPLPADEEQPRLFEGFVQCLAALGGRPLALLVDDAHWADGATLAWLGYLAGRLAEQRSGLLLAITYRPDEAPPALVRLAAGWSRQGLVRRLPLARLNAQEAGALAGALGVASPRRETLQAQSAGNPYFLIELARSGAGDAQAAPSVLGEVIRARLDRLGGPTRQVLQAASVLEPDFDFPSLRRTSGRGEEETLDALDEAIATGVIVEGERYNFSHPLLAQVVREGLSGARRAFLYRRAAEALEAGHAGRLGEVAGRLHAAYHEAGDTGRAAHYAEMAAEHALGLAAAAEAVAFYRQALTLEPSPGRYLGLGSALFPQGDLAPARSAIEQALAGFLAAGDRLGAGRACLELASTYLPAGRGDQVLRWAEQSLAYLDVHANPDVDPRAHAQAHFLLGAGRLRSGGSLDEAEAELAESARLAEEKDLPDHAARSRLELGNLLAQRGDLAGAIAAYHACIRLAHAAADRLEEILGYNNAAYHEMLAGDLPAATRDIEAALKLDEEWVLVPARQYLYSTRGEIALAEEQWDEAESWLRRGLAEAERQGNREQAAGCQANLALAARGRGDLDAALVLLETGREQAAPLPTPFLQAQIELRLAELHLERGERLAAGEALTRAEERLSGHGFARLEAWAARLKKELKKQS